METRVVHKGHRGFRKHPLIPAWRTPAATGNDAAPVQAFDPPLGLIYRNQLWSKKEDARMVRKGTLGPYRQSLDPPSI